jgi:hypothetical protein
LIVGGDFTKAGGNPVGYLAKWDGSTWSEFGGGMDNWVRSLALINGEIYAGGSFTKAGNDSVNRFAKWNGAHWEKFGTGMTPSQWGNPLVTSIVPVGEDIYCSGTFEVAGGKPSSFLARWGKTGVGIKDPGHSVNNNLNLQNIPNPFTCSTVISWNSALYSRTILKIFDIMGNELWTLVDAELPPGEHHTNFDANGLSAGVYFYQIQVDGKVVTRKMIVIR